MKKSIALSVLFLSIALSVLLLSSVPALAQSLHRTDGTLEEKYARYNASYFDNRLPKDTIIKYSSIGTVGEIGETECETGRPCIIRLDPHYNKLEDSESITLLHEMCHMDTRGVEFDQHGLKWQACMKRLASIGAFDKFWYLF